MFAIGYAPNYMSDPIKGMDCTKILRGIISKLISLFYLSSQINKQSFKSLAHKLFKIS